MAYDFVLVFGSFPSFCFWPLSPEIPQEKFYMFGQISPIM